MKMTKLSLIAAMAISSAFAGGDIVPAETSVASVSSTTISGKAVAYYYTDSTVDLFDGDSSKFGTAVTLDVSHKINDMFTANFGAVGYVNVGGSADWLFESNGGMDYREAGAFFNVANITATFDHTTFVAGRQLLGTPMVTGFDWLLAPGSFEAYTLVNTSFENVTLIASYITQWRPMNAGDNWVNLTDIGDGDNWTVSASYASDAFNASIWYYNVDAGGAAGRPDAYKQYYVDAGTTFSGIDFAAQYVSTDYVGAADSTAWGVKASTKMSDITVTLAYNNVQDNPAGYVGVDGLYTTSWNSFAANSIGSNVKVEVAGEFSGISTTVSYAAYDYDGGDGNELDVILGYALTDAISLDAIYSNTDYGSGADVDALELIATYKF